MKIKIKGEKEGERTFRFVFSGEVVLTKNDIFGDNFPDVLDAKAVKAHITDTYDLFSEFINDWNLEHVLELEIQEVE